MGLLSSIFAAKAPYGTPPFSGEGFQQTGGASPPSRGLAGFLERALNPTNAIGQFGQALVASSGGPLSDAMSYMIKARETAAQQKPKGPHFEHIGNSYGIVDDATGQFTPTYTAPAAPQAPDDFTRTLTAAGIDPASDQAKSMYLGRAQNISDPIVQVQLGNGSFASVPRSQMGNLPGMSPLGGAASPAPVEPPPASTPPAGGVAPAPPPPRPGGLAPRGLRNNNPLNLTISPFTRSQPGFKGTDSGGRYATFDSPESGLGAARSLLGSYARRGFDTPAEIINRWAPSAENGASTENYIRSVAGRLGIGANDVVPSNRYGDLVSAMSDFENGRRGSVRVSGSQTRISSKAEYDALPSGTPFIAPDGSRRVKP